MKKFKPLTWEKEPVLSKDLLPNLSSKELPQEFSKLVDENFDELIGEEPKQETLEDAAERMYSEEDMINFAKWSNRKEDKSKSDLLKIWFEQFKKK
jgi:aldehyde:ferredoxin oxidoreductase